MTDTKKGLLEAVLAVQQKAPDLDLKKTGENPAYRGSKYLQLDQLVKTLAPTLAENGLVWMTFPSGTHEYPTLDYRLAHAASGEVLEGTMPLLLVKRDPQGQGSAITYARRYALCAVLNIVADEDDDGDKAAGAGETPASTYGRAPKPPAAPRAAQAEIDKVKTLIRRLDLRTEPVRAILRGAGMTFEAKANPRDLVQQMTPEQAEEVLKFLREPVKDGTSDVSGDASGFEHPKDEGAPLFDPSVPS